MTQLGVQAILPCNTHQYYIERDSAAFRAFLAKALSLGVYNFRDTWKDANGSTFVRLVTKPEISSWVPSAVRNAVANASEIEFHDIIEYKPSDTSGPTYTLHVRTESPFLGDKLRVNTTLELIPLEETNSTLQRLTGTIQVKMFGFGSLIEKAIRDNVIKTYQQLPEIASRWEAYRTEVLVKKESDPSKILLAGRPPVGGDIEYIRSIMHATTGQKSALVARNTDTDALVTVSSKSSSMEKKEEEEEIIVEERNGADGAIEAVPLVVHHARRRTASELILDALPSLDNLEHTNSNPPTENQAPRHWRGFSWDSIGSQGSAELEAEMSIEISDRQPGTKGAYTAWKRFNRDYAVWESYWAQVGVHAATAAHRGVLKVVYCLKKELAVICRVLLLFLLLLLVRVHILRVKSSNSSPSFRNGNHKEEEVEGVPPRQQQMATKRRSSRLARISS